ncbi:MAG TPA: cobaltochelatase subunit CobN, partial [Pirellulales bacterium]|nr:cobaltochelatase subunit CobN [Pirellulales bacterium]
MGELPLFYPFILNDPGEGAQAKRRSHAVIIDHLTPPMTSADAYGHLGRLMQLVDEYYQVEMLDPSKLPLVQKQIWDLIEEANLQADLKFLLRENHGDHVHEWEEKLTADGTPVSLAQMRGQDVAHLVQELDGYLCELAGAQIRDGLHILGQPPMGEQLIGLLQALTRLPNLDIPSLPQALAHHLGLDWQRLTSDKGARLAEVSSRFLKLADRPVVTHADALEVLDELGRHLLDLLGREGFQADKIDKVLAALSEPGASAAGAAATDQIHSFPGSAWERTAGEAPPRLSPTGEAEPPGQHVPRRSLGTREPTTDLHCVLAFVAGRLVPSLRQTPDEIDNLLRGLDGEYVPAGPSGAPTRGMAHVLPSGRNFYAVDPRALPSAAAWQVGQELAREVLERHRRESGAYPESVGISMWGTSAMRTHGDDVAEVFALLGVKPIWQPENRRLTGVDVIPLAELGRPRVDVTIRISGFFRDAFPHLIQLLDEAVQTVIARDEPLEQNFVRKHYLADLAEAVAAGEEGAAERAGYRIFGSKPGCYGAGLLALIDERNWRDDADLAETYVNWGGYAYTAS